MPATQDRSTNPSASFSRNFYRSPPEATEEQASSADLSRAGKTRNVDESGLRQPLLPAARSMVVRGERWSSRRVLAASTSGGASLRGTGLEEDSEEA